MKCPNCGNQDPATIESNGCKPSDPDYTLLCLAKVPADVTSYYAAEPDENGLYECGWQWNPQTGRER
jgi:hypothetical protein